MTLNAVRYHRFRIERDGPTQEHYGSIVVGIPIGVGDFDRSSISTTEESIVRRCLSIPEGVLFIGEASGSDQSQFSKFRNS